MSEMNSFSIKLLKEYDRPHISIKGFPALIDTGAAIPMMAFTRGPMELVFNGSLVKKDVPPISGIGGKCEGDIYVAKFSNRRNEIFYNGSFCS